MNPLNVLSAILLVLGVLFFIAGSFGLLRFKGAHSRLHALSKADNLGLGLISLSCLLKAPNAAIGFKILFIWILALSASAVTCFIIAEWEMNHGDNSSNL